MERGYKKLLVWQKADELTKEIYLATKRFPKNEFKQFINIALGSLAETEYLLEFCFELKYLSVEEFNRLESIRKGVGGLLWNLYKSFTL